MNPAVAACHVEIWDQPNSAATGDIRNPPVWRRSLALMGFDSEPHRNRSLVERAYNRLKGW